MGDIVVVGSGMAGLGASRRLRNEGRQHRVLDGSAHPGGHTRSFESNGFWFDEGPHLSFSDNDDFKKMLDDSVEGITTTKAAVNNLWQGHWITHPAQANLHGLPPAIVADCINDYVTAKNNPPAEHLKNYEEWLLASFGETFARTFPMEYGERYHTAHASQMSTDWLGPRLYQLDLHEMLVGALDPNPADVHYISEIRYPTAGGFQTFIDPLLAETSIESNKRVTSVDPDAKTLELADGETVAFDHLVSSMPVPDLVAMITSAPGDVREAASKLADTKVVTVNIGVAREDLSDAHWTYFYDRDLTMVRNSYPHMWSPGTAPDGCGSVQAELYYSDKYRPLDVDPQELIEPTRLDLVRCGILREDDEILVSEARLVSHANIIFDLDRVECLPVVNDYLASIGVESVGRFGEWGPHWTDQSFVSGEDGAQRALDATR
ncbi:MAG: protoporphyrinogen oxidase [Acidimicrobiales bacterium]|jgi:protoporphyrinogen oxidase